MGVSRSALTRENVAEAVDMFNRFGPHNTPPHYFVWLHQAARSVLAGVPIQWCSAHDSVRPATPHYDGELGCWLAQVSTAVSGPCRIDGERLLVEGLDQ